jgi:DNA-binding CsgD family transcriptional regulator
MASAFFDMTREQQAAEMKRLGYTPAQIAKDLGLKIKSVHEMASRARTPEDYQRYRSAQRASDLRRRRAKGMQPKSQFWTFDRQLELALLWKEGLTFAEIGERLGVSRNAIAGKVGRLGLPWRKPPVQ